MKTFARRNRTLAPDLSDDVNALNVTARHLPRDAQGFVYLGPSWEQVVASWPEERRERMHAERDRLIAVGWNESGAAYVAFERISEEQER